MLCNNIKYKIQQKLQRKYVVKDFILFEVVKTVDLMKWYISNPLCKEERNSIITCVMYCIYFSYKCT